MIRTPSLPADSGVNTLCATPSPPGRPAKSHFKFHLRVKFRYTAGPQSDDMQGRGVVAFGMAGSQLATACGETTVCWEMRVSVAVKRITPGQTLRQKGKTARESELFKPSAANSSRRIWASSADRRLAS